MPISLEMAHKFEENYPYIFREEHPSYDGYWNGLSSTCTTPPEIDALAKDESLPGIVCLFRIKQILDQEIAGKNV